MILFENYALLLDLIVDGDVKICGFWFRHDLLVEELYTQKCFLSDNLVDR